MKKSALLITVISLILLCGCTGYREINRGYTVTAMGFIEKDGNFNIIIETMSSSDVTDKPPEKIVLSGSGVTLEAAFGNLKSQLIKPLYFEQLGTIVLDSDLNQLQQDEIMDFFENLQSVSWGIYIVQSSDINALFDTETPGGILGYDIIGLVKNFENQGGSELSNQFYQLRRAPSALPVVDIADNQLIFKTQGEQK